MANLLNNANSERFFGNSFSAESLFCDLSPQTAQSFAKIKRKVNFAKNQAIFSTGEMPCNIYVLLQGEARLYINSKNQKHCIVRNINQNEILGLPESLSFFPYETGIETLSPCVCESFKRDDFINLLKDNPQISFRLLKMLGYTLQKSYHHFSSTIIK